MSAVSAKAFDRRKTHQQVERAMATDPRVVVSVCTLSGNLTVRAWDRKEVRARSGGIQVELTRVDQGKSEPATELRLTESGRHRSCVQFDDVELDVPRGASVKVQTTNGDIHVTGVARVTANSQSGDITIAKVSEETIGNAIGGEISVSDSTGSFKLHTVGGSIDTSNLRSVAADDAFSASTVNGEVTLDHVQHPQISANTVNGDISFAGPLQRSGGRYSFQSISGKIRLALPADSSFRLTASLGEGVKLNSDFNLNYSENQSPGGIPNRGAVRRVVAGVGGSDTAISVMILSGSLQLNRQ
jgi:DUF4097 and DUF4098 domain-containing protein YvlB